MRAAWRPDTVTRDDQIPPKPGFTLMRALSSAPVAREAPLSRRA